MKAVVIYPADGGTIIHKDVDGFKGARVEIGGADIFLEAVPIGENFTMYVDEDGIAKRLPRNQAATDIASKMLAKLDRGLMPGDYIKGTAVFLGLHETEDDCVECDLPESVIAEYFNG